MCGGGKGRPDTTKSIGIYNSGGLMVQCIDSTRGEYQRSPQNRAFWVLEVASTDGLPGPSGRRKLVATVDHGMTAYTRDRSGGRAGRKKSNWKLKEFADALAANNLETSTFRRVR